MATLNTNRNIRTMLLGRLINSKETLNGGIRGDKVDNLVLRVENLDFSPAHRQMVILCGTNKLNKHATGYSKWSAIFRSYNKKRNSVTNVYITRLYPVTSANPI